jgi:hypothetical protein
LVRVTSSLLILLLLLFNSVASYIIYLIGFSKWYFLLPLGEVVGALFCGLFIYAKKGGSKDG